MVFTTLAHVRRPAKGLRNSGISLPILDQKEVTMTPYKDINGDSGVLAYEHGDGWIRVQFKHGGTYEYRSLKIGAAHLSTMKTLAASGDGLNAYINTNSDVKNGYSSKY